MYCYTYIKYILAQIPELDFSSKVPKTSKTQFGFWRALRAKLNLKSWLVCTHLELYKQLDRLIWILKSTQLEQCKIFMIQQEPTVTEHINIHRGLEIALRNPHWYLRGDLIYYRQSWVRFSLTLRSLVLVCYQTQAKLFLSCSPTHITSLNLERAFPDSMNNSNFSYNLRNFGVKIVCRKYIDKL